MAKVLERAGTFLASVREEIKQVSWPAREEVLGSAIVVFIGVALLASFISVCDVILTHIAKILLQ
ncbi:MAG: preprotein translocase subunit SecE [Candidatus Omnitrophica bacterium]|nr:preprotein translocase subunit SecE [Candidatus Omnitrophota bacterium]